MESFYLIDTHAHIDMLDNTEEAIQNAINCGVKKIIVPCAYPNDIEKIHNIAEKYENIYGLLGVHPSEARDWNDSLIEKIKNLANSNKIIGIGEIGLDYYWDKSFNEAQKDVFIKQIKLSNELNLPICVHDREAHKDSFDILKKYNKNSNVIMHCFSGSVEFARECIKEGWYLALGGVVTFKNAIKMKEVAIDIPLEKLLLETDTPYLTPVPYRGKENQPAYVKYVAEEIAKLRNTTFEEIAQITSQNAERVFKI
ncbi:TatD family hydrolase [bacterium]|nr:TatD family hydrolase [bacterium]